MSSGGFQACARFGLGPHPGEIKKIESDPRGWLKAQLEHPVIPPTLQNVPMIFKRNINKNADEMQKKAEKKEMGQEIRALFIEQTAARFSVHQATEQPFIERLVMFWSNHFSVSIQKPAIAGLVNSFEAMAIRPHVLGKFADMLIASSRHPAMRAYLDNAISIGPNSVAGQRRGKGLNENLAREILELHTLGVNGGYTQTDVTNFAKIITGWSVSGEDPVQFQYYDIRHEPGSKILLGKTYTEDGEKEGLAALHNIARHPATAKHIATKLARHFVSDIPPQGVVDYLAGVFTKTDGDLRQLAWALVNLEECWTNPLAKYKSSYEYIVSMARLLNFQPEPKRVFGLLSSLNFRPFNAASPAGYDDTADFWMSPDALMKRIDLSQHVAAQIRANIVPATLAEEAFGPVMRAETAFVIKGAPSGADGIAFVLSAPEFMRR